MTGRYADVVALPAVDDDAMVDPSWTPLDLGPVVAGHYAQPVPTVLQRDDGQALFYLGQINGIHGPSGEGKGWIALLAVVDQLQRGHTVMLVDLEDTAPSIVARMRLLGATDRQIVQQLNYIRPSTPFEVLAVEHLAELVTERRPTLIVVDSIGEAFGLDGIDENLDADVGPWLRRVARRLADLGPAVLLIDHSTKAADNPLYPSGSKRKRAAIGGASYLVSATTPLVAGTGGRLRLTCAKDRHGSYARGEHVADLVMTTDPLGTRVQLYAPGPTSDAELPVVLAARAAVQAAKAEGRPMSQKLLIGAMKVKAGTDTRRGGIYLAVGRGALVETAGAHNARMFTYVHELSDATCE